MRGRHTGLGLAVLLSTLAPAAAVHADGAVLFDAVCAGCHNIGGTGVPGLAPPLDRPEFWQALGPDAPTYLGGVVTKGFNMPIMVRGERYAGMFMAPMSGVPDEELAQIVSWVLQTMGDTPADVPAAFIADLRAGSLGNADLKAMRPPTK